MEIKVGVVDTPRELTLETSESADAILATVTDALAGDGVVVLTDVHQRKVLIPAAKLAYVELGDPRERRVGFGVS